MRILNAIRCTIFAILAGFAALFGFMDECCDGAVKMEYRRIGDKLLQELPVIKRAAERNNCRGDDFLILLAIRKAENGRPGREFGILNPDCLEQIAKRPQSSLDIQAGWAAATVINNRRRWLDASRPGDFIEFLAERYCPPSIDSEGNENWKRNVRYFYARFKGFKKENT